MSNSTVHDTASDVMSEAGEVIVDGPDGVAVSFTPQAAVRTAGKLIDAAAAAHGDDAIEKGRKN